MWIIGFTQYIRPRNPCGDHKHIKKAAIKAAFLISAFFKIKPKAHYLKRNMAATCARLDTLSF